MRRGKYIASFLPISCVLVKEEKFRASRYRYQRTNEAVDRWRIAPLETAAGVKPVLYIRQDPEQNC